MRNCHSEDGRTLYPWTLDQFERLWNDHAAKPLGFRTWTACKSNSRSKAAARLSYVLRDKPIGFAAAVTLTLTCCLRNSSASFSRALHELARHPDPWIHSFPATSPELQD